MNGVLLLFCAGLLLRRLHPEHPSERAPGKDRGRESPRAAFSSFLQAGESPAKRGYIRSVAPVQSLSCVLGVSPPTYSTRESRKALLDSVADTDLLSIGSFRGDWNPLRPAIERCFPFRSGGSPVQSKGRRCSVCWEEKLRRVEEALAGDRVGVCKPALGAEAFLLFPLGTRRT